MWGDAGASHPAVFVTLTAPSFGQVHMSGLTRDGRPVPCRVRRDELDRTCRHGQPLTCRARHAEGDPELGQPLCGDCFDYEAAVLWNAHASELWRRTRIDVYRQLARLTGQTERAVKAQVRVSYVKVAEFQRRGLLHFHLALRLDSGGDSCEAPPAEYTVQLLTNAFSAAAARVRVPYPSQHRLYEREPALDLEQATPPAEELPALRLHDRDGLREARWGEQIDTRPIHAGELEQVDRALERGQVAGYLAKYATKHTEALGGLDRCVTIDDLPTLPVNPHVWRLVATALLLPRRYPTLKTGWWAHQLGYGGHWLTKSRRWSTTFTALRAQRRAWNAARRPDALAIDEDQEVLVASWQLSGVGYRLPGDAWLAELARDRAEVAREAEREQRADRQLAKALAA